jgi:Flp pilus assembly protein TadD
MLDRSPGDRTFAYVVTTAGGTADPTYATLATGYRAFKRGDYAGAIEHLTKLTEAGIRQSPTAQQQAALAVPYLAASLSKVGRGAEAQAVLSDFQKRAGRDFYYLLASAYVQGLGGDRRAALDDLWQAQLSWSDMGKLSVPPPFQVPP